MKKIYVVGEMTNYADFIVNHKLVDNISEADIVLFTGGEDVDPSFYGEKKHISTCSNIGRDNYEKKVFDKIKPNQLALGICRGSQFLCVMNGGKLVQDTNNHAIWGTHTIFNTKTGEKYEITSTHHQMQYPYNLDKKDYDVLYTANEGSFYDGSGINAVEIMNNGEPEIVLYHKENKPKCLAIQGHPEYMDKKAPVISMLNELIDNLVK